MFHAMFNGIKSPTAANIMQQIPQTQKRVVAKSTQRNLRRPNGSAISDRVYRERYKRLAAR